MYHFSSPRLRQPSARRRRTRANVSSFAASSCPATVGTVGRYSFRNHLLFALGNRRIYFGDQLVGSTGLLFSRRKELETKKSHLVRRRRCLPDWNPVGAEPWSSRLAHGTTGIRDEFNRSFKRSVHGWRLGHRSSRPFAFRRLEMGIATSLDCNPLRFARF